MKRSNKQMKLEAFQLIKEMCIKNNIVDSEGNLTDESIKTIYEFIGEVVDEATYEYLLTFLNHIQLLGIEDKFIDKFIVNYYERTLTVDLYDTEDLDDLDVLVNTINRTNKELIKSVNLFVDEFGQEMLDKILVDLNEDVEEDAEEENIDVYNSITEICAHLNPIKDLNMLNVSKETEIKLFNIFNPIWNKVNILDNIEDMIPIELSVQSKHGMSVPKLFYKLGNDVVKNIGSVTYHISELVRLDSLIEEYFDVDTLSTWLYNNINK
ncbi:MAG: hypothetical protein ACRCX2_24920 [Paraclostridium sp.]